MRDQEDIAAMEAHQSTSWYAYIKAVPGADTDENKRLFSFSYRCAWHWSKYYPRIEDDLK